ncbi:phage tail protein [Pseudaminobacter sp. 19-2017]|uniref:Phage tail protein n=1 Tax=Pseudaminobacter soli (ex Zhang et al. 2022) TaxID=2831468 RepID=A0A942I2K4_9HYPH|nr:phage tail protein [Pseudaminobacter soli]MBS3648873.1 phage tail protein [Pseudaminobacter soli]
MQLGVLFGGQLLGSAFAGKMLMFGASVGASLLMRRKQEPQGKLNEVRVSSSSYGRTIPKCYGTIKVTGNLFWATDFEEKKRYIGKKQSSKGASKGKAVEVYDYYANFAMALCEGPVGQVLRVWADNNLIYDRMNPLNPDIVGQGFTNRGQRDQKAQGGKKGGGESHGRFVFQFYNGSENQKPNGFMVSKQGAQNVPAFRGLAYLWFMKFKLGDFGNRIPTITAEISVRPEVTPHLRIFQNMEPKAKTSFRTIYNRIGSGRVVADPFYDPVRKMFYHEAIDSTGRYVIRGFNVDKVKETVRFSYQKPDDKPWLPQEQLSMYGDAITRNRFNYENIWQYCGVAGNGNLVFTTNLGPYPNHKAMIFVNPRSKAIEGVYGGTISTLFPPYGGGARFPVYHVSSQLTSHENVRANSTFIADQEGVIHVMDAHGTGFNVALPAGFNAPNSVQKVSAGVPGTNYGIIIREKGLYTQRGRVSTLLPRMMTVGSKSDDATPDLPEDQKEYPVQEPARFLFELPGWTSKRVDSVLFAGYCAAADAIAVLATTTGNANLEKGLYAALVHADQGAAAVDGTENIIYLKKITDNQFHYPEGNTHMPDYLSGPVYRWIVPNSRTVYSWDFVEGRGDVYSYGTKMPFYGDDITYQYYWSEYDAVLYFSEQYEEGRWILGQFQKYNQTGISLADIVEDVCLSVNIPKSRLDVEPLRSQGVRGYMIESTLQASQVLEELSSVYMFDVVESDNILKFKWRDTPSVVTIPQSKLGVVETDFGGENEYYQITRTQEIELPERCVVQYMNSKEDYEAGSEHAKRPLRPLPVMNSRESLDLTLNMALEPKEAKTMAQRILYAAWAERGLGEFALPRDYLWLDPSDVITIHLDNGEALSERITDIEIGANLQMEIKTVSQIEAVYSTVADVERRGGIIPSENTVAPNCVPGIFNLPYLFDGDANYEDGTFGYYWAALPYEAGFREGILVARNRDSSEVEGTAYVEALWGSITGMVPPPPVSTDVTDTQTQITLKPTYEWNEPDVIYTWDSIPDDEWPNDSNMVIIGGEVILFKNVVEHDDGSATISHLIRGYRGTTNAAYTHRPGENFVLVTADAMRIADEPVAKVGEVRNYSVLSSAQMTIETPANLNAASRRPWPVGGVKRTNNVVDDTITVTWKRSTRFGGTLMNSTGAVPLNEQEEEYEVFLLKAPFDPNTFNPENAAMYWHASGPISTQSYTFTKAALAAAGLTHKSDVHVVIYQNSQAVGRGFARGLSLRYSMFGI